MAATATVVDSLAAHLGGDTVSAQPTMDEIPTVWVAPDQAHQALAWLSATSEGRYRVLYDLTAIDERSREASARRSDFTLVYHLLSYDANADIRLKVPLMGEYPMPIVRSVSHNISRLVR